MRVGSLFSGVGGFDLGFERAGATVAWHVENDKQCRAVLRRHWPGVDSYEDVRNVVGIQHERIRQGRATGNQPTLTRRIGRSSYDGAPSGSVDRPANDEPARLAPVDLICGGFPCQDISVAGRRAGLAGERSGLWYEFHRIVGEVAPRWVVIENVGGLLSSNDGRDLAAILSGLADLGYWWAYRVFDSQYFGVAQRRRRVFIVGHLGSPCPPEVLFEPESLPGYPAPSREAGERTAATLTRGADSQGKGGYAGRRQEDDVNVVAGTLGGNRAGGHRLDLDNAGAYPLAYNAEHGLAPHGSMGGASVTPALSESEHKGHTLIAHTLRAKEFVASEDGTGRGAPPVAQPRANTVKNITGHHGDTAVDPNDVAFCLPAAGANVGGGGGQFLSQAIPRRLTPREAERLQAFPDDWTAWGMDENGERVEMADGPRYRMMGNAVTVNVAEWIGRRIMAADAALQDERAGTL